MLNRLTFFLLAFLVWVVLTLPFLRELGPDPQLLGCGVLAALLATHLFGGVFGQDLRGWWNPVRWWWGLVYLAVFARAAVRANLDVMYRVLHPALPMRPGIVRVRTRLQSPVARTLLANSVTLTPGMLTMDLRDDGTMYIHCIDVTETDLEAATRLTIARYEGILAKVFE